jgi:GT2 family glycosyltransferase
MHSHDRLLSSPYDHTEESVADSRHLERRLAQMERRIHQLEYALRTTDAHVAALERSVIFRILRRVGRPILDAKARAGHWLGRMPLLERFGANSYADWVDRQSPDPLPDLAASPSFSVLIQAIGSRREGVEESVASVRSQTYGCWELRICYDGVGPSWISEYVRSLERADRRIQGIPSDGESRSAAFNRAATLSTGDYVLMLGEGDRLAQDALHRLAAAHPADIIYGDEDRVDDSGRPVEPLFKPDWSPDLLLSGMYLGRMMAISRQAWDHAGGLRPEFESALDYDLALRVTDHADTVKHQPHLLYHGRRRENPPSATVRRALEETLLRRGASAVVEDGACANACHIRWKPRSHAKTSLIICSRSPRLLEQCLDSIRAHTSYSNREIVVVQHLGKENRELERTIERYGARRVVYSGVFHFSRMNNFGAEAATGDVLVFLNDDVAPLEDSWLERLTGQMDRPDVGVAGARLLYPLGTLQHGGIVIGIGDGCGHIGRGSVKAPYWPWLHMSRDVEAVTGACLAIRAPLFWELGGFADEFPSNYNDTDLCLRVREAGYRIIYDTSVVLRHYEAQSRRTTVSLSERETWYDRWAHVIDAGDPFYSRHLTTEREDLSLRA